MGAGPWKFHGVAKPRKEILVIPRIELGNLVLLPQPLRGELHGKDEANAQAHDKVTTPPHNYLATYFWLEHEFGAQALVHFGTHGSEFALPGKPNGMSQNDWCDMIMGSMPNFNPWIIENMVESSPVRRRVYGTLISHLSPPIVNAGLSDELANLHETLDKWESMEDGALKEKFREEITRQVKQTHLDADLQLTIPEDGKLDSAGLAKVSEYLHAIEEETTPTNLHVYGERPRQDLLVPYLVNVLRSPFLKALAELQHDHQHEAGIDHDHDHHHHHALRPMAESIVKMVVEQNLEPLDAVNAALERSSRRSPRMWKKA